MERKKSDPELFSGISLIHGVNTCLIFQENSFYSYLEKLSAIFNNPGVLNGPSNDRFITTNGPFFNGPLNDRYVIKELTTENGR